MNSTFRQLGRLLASLVAFACEPSPKKYSVKGQRRQFQFGEVNNTICIDFGGGAKEVKLMPHEFPQTAALYVDHLLKIGPHFLTSAMTGDLIKEELNIPIPVSATLVEISSPGDEVGQVQVKGWHCEWDFPWKSVKSQHGVGQVQVKGWH